MSARTPPPPSPDHPAALRFGRYALLPGPRQLLADGVAVPIGGRAFDLLSHLARHADRAVSTDELCRAVWPERQVGINNVRVQITALRKLLGDGVIAHHTTRGYRLVPPLLDDDAAAEDEAAVPGNLPGHLPALIGREADLRQLAAEVGDGCRVTLAGPAGVGKTALARAAAGARRGLHADGVWWVELAAMADPAQLPEAVAVLLGLKLPGRAPVDELAAALSDRRMLLVLDNCEHLVRAVCDLADALLRRAPRVGVLATSRRSLKCAGERVRRLPPLGLPDAPGLAAARRSGAVALFEARATRAEPGFALTRDNVDAVTDICRRLDGIPLAIGLAAARVPLLGVGGLRDLLAERLRLLTGREPDARGQPQALNATLDWSHGLLAPAEQRVLRRLGVFAGSFGLASVRHLVADEALDDWGVLDALNALIDHSLLNSDGQSLQSDGQARYTLHESVRLYARNRLDDSGEAPALRRRHALHLLALTGSPQREAAHDRMDIALQDADHDNLRAALAWAGEHDLELAMRLAVQGGPFRRVRGHHLEARRLGAALLADPRSAAHPQRRAELRLALAPLCFEQDDLDEVLQLAHASLADLDGLDAPLALADAWSWIGSTHLMRRELDAAEPALRQSLAWDRAAGHRAGEASQLNNLALVFVERGRHAEARALMGEALALNRQLDATWGIAITLENLGELAYAIGDLPAARAAWEEAMPLIRRIGHRYHEALLLQYLAQLARRQGRPREAEALLRESLRISLPQRMAGLVADALVVGAGLALDAGLPHRAAMLLQVAQQGRARTAIGPALHDLAAISGALDEALDEDGRQSARLEADRTTPAQAAEELAGTGATDTPPSRGRLPPD